MNFSRALVLMVSPRKLSPYLHLLRERRSYYYTLSKVTHIESAQRLHDKIRRIDRQMNDLVR